jgi:hypothetical protein
MRQKSPEEVLQLLLAGWCVPADMQNRSGPNDKAGTQDKNRKQVWKSARL